MAKESFHVLTGQSHSFFIEISIQVSHLIFNWVVFLLLNCKGSLYLRSKVPHHIFNFQISYCIFSLPLNVSYEADMFLFFYEI